MIDILTYAIARRKSAAKLDELYSQTKAVADAAKDSAEQDDSCGPAGCSKCCCYKLCAWPGREWPTVVFHQEKHLKGGIRNG